MTKENNTLNNTKVISFRVTQESYGEFLSECELKKLSRSEYIHLLIHNYRNLEVDYIELVSEIKGDNSDCPYIKRLKELVDNQRWIIEED